MSSPGLNKDNGWTSIEELFEFEDFQDYLDSFLRFRTQDLFRIKD